jgi:hypothetical protein
MRFGFNKTKLWTRVLLTENGIAISLDRRLMRYTRKHWTPTIRGGALLKPTSLIGTENKIAGKGPDRMRGSSGRESHSGAMLKVPFSARLIATPQYRCPSAAAQ